jgi:putrescine aminotransferase
MNSLDLHEVSRLYRDHISPDLSRLLKFGGPGSLEVQSRGSWIIDHLGREYLDFAGGYGVFSLGHGHPEVIEAVQCQLQLQSLSSRVLLNPQQAYLAKELADIAPGALRYSFFCNSGTEAVEGALKLARLSTGRQRIIACDNSYHGKTMGSLSVTGRLKYREPFEPLIGEVTFVPFGDAAALEQAIDDRTAAFIVEPVQGEGGIHVAPPGYLSNAQEWCRQRGALLIADEVQTGLGRTGKMFAVEHWGVEPDILTLAKALGGGVLAVGAFMGTPEVWKAFKGQPLIHTSTFGGSPLACVAARTTLKILTRDRLAERAARVGQELLENLNKLQAEYPSLIREVRGRGLMLGVELSREEYAGSLITEMVKHKVIAVYTLNQPRVIRLEPPLTVTAEEVDLAVAALEQSLKSTREKFPMDK